MIEATAPVRICDNGGWTDTWFGGPGRVCNIAVQPGVEVSIRATDRPDPVLLEVDSFGDRYPIVPGEPRVVRHPLLEAAIDAMPPPSGQAVDIRVRSTVPAGCGAGTSAAVAVALLGALAVTRAEPWTARDIAYAAHRLEVEVLGTESGIQDQLSAGFGGISYLEIEPYPEATVHALPEWPELGDLLTLVFLGRPHDSSGVHRQVIENIEHRAGDAADVFSRLREAAVAARDAVVARDLARFGRAMVANTDAQRDLHPALVAGDAQRTIDLAAGAGALGWKVNGAGGDGGSLTLVSATTAAKAALEQQVLGLDPRYTVVPVTISPVGLQVVRRREAATSRRGRRGPSGARGWC